MAGGSAHRAHLRLKDGGRAIPAGTIQSWATGKYAERYEQIQEQEAERIAKLIAAEAEGVARKATGLEHKLLDKLDSTLDEMSPKDIANALRNVSTTKGINVDKIANPNRGRATSIIEHRPASVISADLERLLARLLSTNGTAEEIGPGDQ